MTQTYYSPFFPTAETPGAKGTTIAVVPSQAVADLNNAINQIVDTGIGDYTPPGLITGLTVTSTIGFDTDGSQIATLNATWNASSETDIGYYVVAIQEQGGGFIEFMVKGNAYSINVKASRTYGVKVRAVDKFGNMSGFTPVVTVTSARDTIPPGPVTNPTISTSLSNFFLSFTPPTDADLDVIEVWENDTNTLNGASKIAEVRGGGYTRGAQTNVKKFFWFRARDTSGNVSAFTTSVTGTTGQITIGDFTTNLSPNETVTSLPTTGTVGKVVFLTTDSKLYRWEGTKWTAAVAATDLTGMIASGQIEDRAITITKFATGLTTVEIASVLPTTGNFVGRVVTLTSDGKLYRYTSTGWTAAVPAVDITGQIKGTQITDNSITTGKIAANAVTADQIAANTITAAQIAAGSITTTQIAAGTIVAEDIAAGAITATKLSIRGASLFPDGSIQDSDWWTSNNNSVTGPGYQNPPGSFYINTDPSPDSVTFKGANNAWLSNGSLSGSTAANIQLIPPAVGGAIQGEFYEFKANLRNTSSRTNLNMVVQWFKADGTFISAVSGFSVNDGVLRPVAFQAQAPAGATAWRLYFDATGTTNPFTGQLSISGITVRQAAGGSLIVDGSVIAAKIASNAITADKIVAGTITAAQIATGTITATQLAAGTITADKIQSGTITGDKISTGTALPGTVTVGNTGVAIGTIQAQAANSSSLSWSDPLNNYLVQGNSITKVANSGNWTGNAYTKDFFIGSCVMTASFGTPSSQAMFGLSDGTEAAASNSFQYLDYAIFWDGSTYGIYESGVGIQNHGTDLNGIPLNSSTKFQIIYDGTTVKYYADGGLMRIVASAVGRKFYAGVAIVNTGSSVSRLTFAASMDNSLSQADPAARINANTTQIDPGKITIAGGTTLANWRSGTDVTKIEGGSIAANSITANKLKVGSRGLSFQDIVFQYVNGRCTWTSGVIFWTDDSGNLQGTSIAASSVGPPPQGAYYYIYWNKGYGNLDVTTTPPYGVGPDTVHIATFTGGPNINQIYGGTIIDGSSISAYTVTADRILVSSLSALSANIGLLRTATSGARTEIESNVIRVYDSNNVLRVRMGVW